MTPTAERLRRIAWRDWDHNRLGRVLADFRARVVALDAVVDGSGPPLPS